MILPCWSLHGLVKVFAFADVLQDASSKHTPACAAHMKAHCRMQAHHWPGSELRWVAGGHVSAFVLQQPAFRRAITDSLERVAAPPPDAGDVPGDAAEQGQAPSVG